MSTAALLAFLSAACAAALSLAAAIGARRSVPRWAFVAGMALFAGESVAIGLAFSAPSAVAGRACQQWRFATLALSPAVWVLFSASYARSGLPSLMSRRGWLALSTAALPLGLWYFFQHTTFSSPSSAAPSLKLDWVGMV